MRSLIRRGRSRLEALPVLGPLLASVSAMERVTLAVLGFTALGFYVFVKVADEVMEGDAGALDRSILLALRNPADPSDPLGPPWLEETMRDLTALGGTAVLTLITLLAMVFLLMIRRQHTAWLVGFSVAGGTLLSQALKWGFDRPRPDLVPHGMSVYSQSFPSGHAMLSAVVYLTLGALLARTQPRTRVKVFLLGAAAALTVIVGISRIYLGVHWPTDVLGGWALGAAWAAGCWLVMLWLQRRGGVEGERDVPGNGANGESGLG
ncbi:phosphatase PAP2 family protein [Xanthobacter autotrophicus DSM 431]|uniref:phosphatase PAP2 family protein n=1 Tax=Xanthobacter nonsaccharivorans TaxID=3119912 RepID=UPI00372BAC34